MKTRNMSSSQSQEHRPTLLIDLKKNRIRIHKATLHLLGDPDYIQFLVNPDSLSLAIRRSIKGDSLAHHIRWNMLGGKQCCDFYSYFLLKSLRDVNYEWKPNRSYRLYGRLNEKENLALFSMKESIDIDNMGEVKEDVQ